MEDVAITFSLEWQSETLRSFQAGGVASRPFSPQIIVLVNVLQFGAQDAGVEIVQPTVETEAMDISSVRAVVAQLADGGIDVLVVGHQRAAVPKRAQILLDDKTDRSGVAQLADLEIGAMGADALGIVLDDLELVFIGNLFDRGHVGALTVKMDRDNSFRFGCDGSLDL